MDTKASFGRRQKDGFKSCVGKSTENIIFFNLHFTWLFGSWNYQKKIARYFENRRAKFPFEVSKLTSLRNKLNLSIKYWFMEAKLVFCICLGPEKRSKYHLETVQTIFSEKKKHYRTMFVKLNFFDAWKCIISGVKHRVSFEPLKKTSCHISKMAIFSKLFGNFMSQMIR